MSLRDRAGYLKLPLRWVLTIPFVLQTLGIVGLVGYLSYVSGQRSIQALAYQLMANVDRQVSHELDHYLQRARRFNQQNAAAMQAETLTPQDLDQLHRHLILQHRQTAELTTLLFGTPQGDLLVSHRVRPRDYGVTTRLTPQELPFEAAVSRAANPPFNQTYAVDAEGNLGRYLKTVNNIDVRDRPWYRQAVETGEPGWTVPFQIADTNLLALNAHQPLYDSTGELIGVFAVNISLNQLSDTLRTLEIGASGQTVILERNGQLIATSLPKEVYTTRGEPDLSGVSEPGTLAFDRQSLADTPNDLLQTAYQHLRDTFGDFDTLRSFQQIEFSVQGERYFLTISPYSDGYGLDWLVATVVPASDFMAEIQHNNRTTALLSLLALGGAIASGSMLSKLIAQRFQHLTQASQALAQGNFEQTISTDSAIAEVQGLATAFNQFAAQLQRSFQQQVEVEATRQSEARFQQLAAMIPGSIYTYTRRADGSHRFGYFNAICRDILELEPADVIADADIALNHIHPKDRPLWEQTLDQSAETLKAFTLVFRFITPSDQVKWLEASCQPQRYADGSITWYGILLDVSARQAAKLALRESEMRFKTVVDHAPDVLVIYDRERRIQYVNERGLELTGWPLTQFLGKRDEELFPPAVTAEYLPILQRAVETRSFQEGEATIHFPDQPPYTIWVKYAPTLDQQGEIQQILAMTIDISERQRMESALRNSETKLLQAQKIVNMGSWDYDVARQQTTWSEGMYAIHQIDPSQPAPEGEALDQLIHPEDLWICNQRIREPLYAGQPCQADLRIVRQSGEVRYLETRGEPIFDDTGQVTHFVGTTLDITERKRAELALQAKTAELDRFFSVALDLLCIANTDGYFLRLNPQWEETLGYPIAELAGSRFLDYVHPEDMDATLAAIAHLSEQNSVRGFVNRYRCQDDSYRWIEWRSVAVGPLIYAAARDITDRQQMEAEIRASEARKQSILSAMPDVIFLLDSGGVYLEAIRSNTAIDVVDTATDPIGKHVSELVSPEIAHRHLQAIQQVLQTRHMRTFEQAVQIGDRWQYEEVTVVPCETNTVLFLIRDISERHRLDAERQRMEADLRSLNTRLQELATVDSLTQVANRRQMESHLQQAWSQCRRAEIPITLVLLDIDHFKRYNDHYGHPQGDACLRQVADILQSHVNRPGDLVSRYGGEEFLIVLPHTDRQGATHLVTTIQQSLAQAQIPHVASLTDKVVTVSMGVAVIMDVASFGNPTEAIATTDKLLYQAKQTRDTYCLQVISR